MNSELERMRKETAVAKIIALSLRLYDVLSHVTETSEVQWHCRPRFERGTFPMQAKGRYLFDQFARPQFYLYNSLLE